MRKQKYNSLSEWKKAEPNAYRASIKKGILPKICHLFGWEYLARKQLLFLTLNDCKTEALKYKTIKEWKYSDVKSYAKASREKWVNECCSHMYRIRKIKGYWTLEKCKQEALKYKSKAEWFAKDNASHRASSKNGWLSVCCKHMISKKKPNKYWSLEKCKEDALKYKTKKEWAFHSSSSYTVSLRNGWIKECSTHMKKRGEKQ